MAGVWAGGHPGAVQSGSKFPTAGLAGRGRWALVGSLASNISEATSSPLKAALIDSRFDLMASLASSASQLASVATLADWPTIRLLLKAIISFFEFPRCLPRPLSVVSSGSWISLATASMVWAASLIASLRGASLSGGSRAAGAAGADDAIWAGSPPWPRRGSVVLLAGFRIPDPSTFGPYRGPVRPPRPCPHPSCTCPPVVLA